MHQMVDLMMRHEGDSWNCLSSLNNKTNVVSQKRNFLSSSPICPHQ